MGKIIYCDVCTTVFDDGLGGDPNSTDYQSGSFRFYNRVLILEAKDLCGDCARKVRDFITKLEEAG